VSKSDKPKIGSKPSVVSLREPPRRPRMMSSEGAVAGVGVSSGAIPSKPQQLCWRFSLVNITSATRRIGAGSAVLGYITGSSLSVQSFAGEKLGEARPAKAAQIIKALSEERPRLSGTVLKKNGADIQVKLCRR
jgi:hypothetical protein